MEAVDKFIELNKLPQYCRILKNNKGMGWKIKNIANLSKYKFKCFQNKRVAQKYTMTKHIIRLQ